MRLLLCAIGFVMLSAVTAAQAAETDQWFVETRVDSMTDQEIRTAKVANLSGFELRVYRSTPKGQVWGTFSLPADSVDTLDTELPIYRIDKLEPVQITGVPRSLASVTGPVVEAKPKWVNFLLWHGEGATPARGALRDVMNGSSVVFRYYLFGGGSKETSFNLIGAKAAIAEALQIAPDPPPGASAFEEERTKSSLRCGDLAIAGKRKELDRCLRIVSDCGRVTTSAEDFQACLDRNSFSKLFPKDDRRR